MVWSSNINMKIKNVLINVSGFFIILYVIFIRIFKFNQYFSTSILSLNLNFFVLYVLTFMSFLFLFNSIFAFFAKKSSKFFSHILNTYFIKNINSFFKNIKNSPIIFYKTYIFSRINISLIVEKPIYNLIKILAKKNKNWIPLLFITLPKFVVATLFVTSLIFNNNFEYFLKSVFLLIIPLLFNVYCFIIEDLAKTNLIYFESHLKFRETSENILLIDYADYTPEGPDAIDLLAHKNNKKMLQWLVYNYDIYRNIYNFVTKIEKIHGNYSLYENLYISACYSSGWCYFWYIF